MCKLRVFIQMVSVPISSLTSYIKFLVANEKQPTYIYRITSNIPRRIFNFKRDTAVKNKWGMGRFGTPDIIQNRGRGYIQDPGYYSMKYGNRTLWEYSVSS